MADFNDYESNDINTNLHSNNAQSNVGSRSNSKVEQYINVVGAISKTDSKLQAPSRTVQLKINTNQRRENKTASMQYIEADLNRLMKFPNLENDSELLRGEQNT